MASCWHSHNGPRGADRGDGSSAVDKRRPLRPLAWMLVRRVAQDNGAVVGRVTVADRLCAQPWKGRFWVLDSKFNVAFKFFLPGNDEPEEQHGQRSRHDNKRYCQLVVVVAAAIRVVAGGR